MDQTQKEKLIQIQFTASQINAVIAALQKMPLENSLEAFMSIQQQLTNLQAQSASGVTSNAPKAL